MESMLAVSLNFNQDNHSLLLVIFHLRMEIAIEDYPKPKVECKKIMDPELQDSIFQIVMVIKRHPNVADSYDFDSTVQHLHSNNLSTELSQKITDIIKILLSADLSQMPNELSVLIVQSQEVTAIQLEQTASMLEQVSIPKNIIDIAKELLRTLQNIDLSLIPQDPMLITVQTSNFQAWIEKSINELSAKVGRMQEISSEMLETMFIVMQLLQLSVLTATGPQLNCEGNVCLIEAIQGTSNNPNRPNEPRSNPFSPNAQSSKANMQPNVSQEYREKSNPPDPTSTEETNNENLPQSSSDSSIGHRKPRVPQNSKNPQNPDEPPNPPPSN